MFLFTYKCRCLDIPNVWCLLEGKNRADIYSVFSAEENRHSCCSDLRWLINDGPVFSLLASDVVSLGDKSCKLTIHNLLSLYVKVCGEARTSAYYCNTATPQNHRLPLYQTSYRHHFFSRFIKSIRSCCDENHSCHPFSVKSDTRLIAACQVSPAYQELR